MLNLRGGEGEYLRRPAPTRNCHGRARNWTIAGPASGPAINANEVPAVSEAQSSWNAIMQYSFLRVFADDGTISADELAMFERLALRDGVVDEKERSVLSGIFARVNERAVSAEVWEGITRFKAQHQIP